jgi:hypothetical protein
MVEGGTVPTTHPFFAWGSATPDGGPTATVEMPPPDATPTTHPFFAQQEMPTPRPTSTRRPTPTPRPTSTPDMPDGAEETTGIPSVAEGGPASNEFGRLGEIVVYDEALNPNWIMGESWDVAYDLAADAYVHRGEKAVAVNPTADYGAVFFTVAPETAEEYLYDDIVGLSFWLNAGDTPLAMSDMGVSIVGSNDIAYYDELDDSVYVDGPKEHFSETRLYYLDFNTDLPPGEWVEVIVWLDDLIYDPDIEYVTGFYLKNDIDYRGTFYVDDVVLLTLGS